MNRLWNSVVEPLARMQHNGVVVVLGADRERMRTELESRVVRAGWVLKTDGGDGTAALSPLIGEGARPPLRPPLVLLLGGGRTAVESPSVTVQTPSSAPGERHRFPEYDAIDMPVPGGIRLLYERTLPGENPRFAAWLDSVRRADTLWGLLRAADRERADREQELAALHRRLQFMAYVLRRIRRDARALRRYRPWRLAMGIARAVQRLRRLVARPGPLDDIEDMADAGLRHLDGGEDGTVDGVFDEPRVTLAAGAPGAAAWPPPATADQASIIVLNRDGAPRLEALFESFRRTHGTDFEFEFLVVDHGSRDASRAVIERHAEALNIRPILLDANDSYSRSNNRAARLARFANLVFLNNDVLFLGPAVPAMLHALATRAELGVVAPVLQYPAPPGAGEPRIQHAGIRFVEDRRLGFMRPVNLDELAPDPAPVLAVPAVTGALMACRKADFERIGGFCERYVYGYEDVDLCLAMRRELGKRAAVLTGLRAEHDESATQKRDRRRTVVRRRLQNIEVLRERFGYATRRLVRQDQALGRRHWTVDPLRVALMVSETGPGAQAGDCFTALELAAALERDPGWQVRLVPRSAGDRVWYDLAGIDVAIALVDAWDPRRIRNAGPGLVCVAWMRNWFDRWAEQPWIDRFDILLCSSERAADHVRRATGRPVQVLRIATSPERFLAPPERASTTVDYCFTGSYWNCARDLERWDPARVEFRFAVYGRGWQHRPTMAPYWKGFAPYHDLPALYRDARVVLDDANHATAPWGSVNSRVFDAIAAGCLPVTNGGAGVRELFGDLVPVFDGPDTLERLLRHYLTDEHARRTRAAQLQKIVLAGHTYAHRARELAAMVGAHFRNTWRIAIKVPAPDLRDAHEWGDFHFARCLARAFAHLGHQARIDLLPEWYHPRCAGDDVALVLRGLRRYVPQASHINLMWNVSHPDKVLFEEYERYDHVFVASVRHARFLAPNLAVPVSALMQCTDPVRFAPPEASEMVPHDILFVGNSRGMLRPSVGDAIDAGLEVEVHGRGWSGLIPARFVRGSYIPNEQLARHYAGARVVLNDHWGDMREEGFISNRIFDALACGATVVTDPVEGLEAVFDGLVHTYTGGGAGLRAVLDALPQTTDADRAERRRVVADRHSFDARVREILAVVRAIDARRSPEEAPRPGHRRVPDAGARPAGAVQGA